MLKRMGEMLNQISKCSQPDVVEAEKNVNIKDHILTKRVTLA